LMSSSNPAKGLKTGDGISLPGLPPAK
jgi:hypothetical protein